MIIGGIANLIRGGWLGKFIPHRSELEYRVKNGRGSVVDKALYHGLHGHTVNAIIFFMCVHHYSQDAILALISAILMWCGSRLGHGEYIQAIFESHQGERRNHLGILEKPFEKLFDKDRQKWGVVMLSLRGAIWGALLCVPFLSLYPLIGGALMGVLYLGCYKWTRNTEFKEAWALSEFMFGIVLWGSVYLAMGG